MTEPTPQEIINARRWKNRRRMAYGAFLGGILFPLLGNYIDNVYEIAMPFYTFVGMVVGAYIGFATVDDKWQK